jgi:uncharacterized membrane protein YgcG
MKKSLAATLALAAIAVLGLPASANAAIVQAFGPSISVVDNAPEFQSADDFVVTQVNPWIIQIRNDGGREGEPLALVDQQSTDLTCQQDDPRQVTCTRFTGGPPIIISINGSFGDDTFTIGSHNPDVTTRVIGHGGNDALLLANGSVDSYNCGNDVDTVERDANDVLITDIPAHQDNGCESDSQGSGGGGGGGSGGGGAGGGGAGGGAGGGGGTTLPPIAPPPPTPYTVLVPQTKGMKLGQVLKKGLTVKAECLPAQQVGGTLSWKGKVVSRKSGTCKPGGKLVFKFRKVVQKRLKNKKSLKLKLVIQDSKGKPLTVLQVKLKK